jgi:SpoU rRNA methylase family enzyme
MRKPFEKLVEEVQALSGAEAELSMGTIAERLGVTVERLADAMDAVKMLRGEPTYISLEQAERNAPPAKALRAYLRGAMAGVLIERSSQLMAEAAALVTRGLGETTAAEELNHSLRVRERQFVAGEFRALALMLGWDVQSGERSTP